MMLIFAGASLFFALAESALLSLGAFWRRRLENSQVNKTKVEKLALLLNDPDGLLATLVLGNTVSVAFFVGLGFWLIIHSNITPISLGIVILFLLVAACEIVPKTFAVRAPETWALRLAGIMVMIMKLTRPIHHVSKLLVSTILASVIKINPQKTNQLSDEEYQELLNLACQQGALDQSEKELIWKIISLDKHTAREAMKPRTQLAYVTDDMSIEEMVEVAKKFKHRRLPILDESTDTIVGILNTRTLLLDPNIDIAESIEFPSFVPETMNLLKLFHSLQKQQRGIAIVMDEFGQVAGLITVEDILETVIGEIRSENETTGLVIEKLSEGRWRVGGTTRIEDFRREYPNLQHYQEIETIGGLICAKLEMIPKVGDTLFLDGLKFTVVSADDRRIRELLVETQKQKKQK